MAEHLARIYGTEEDKVHCPFYYKIGACRHGDRCSRDHVRPDFSQTLMIPHMYQIPPPGPDGNPIPDNEKFEEFVEDIYGEFDKFGKVEEVHICQNLGDHLLGNVYVKFSKEEEAEEALKGLHGRYYEGVLVLPEYSPVTDFREATCRQRSCNRGGYCNFMHLKNIPRDIQRDLRINFSYEQSLLRQGGNDRSRGRRNERRSPPPYNHRPRRHRSRSRSRHRSDRGRRSEREERVGGAREVRENSAERLARIESWNKERESTT